MGLRYAAHHFAQWVILAWCMIGLLRLVFKQLPLIFLHESVGYGDSTILLAVEEFRRTGILYAPVGPDHLTPVLYSPLLYVTHLAAWAALPASINPYIGPRLLELFWFLACVFLTGALARRLVPARSALWLGVLLAASYAVVIPWVLQLRSDFPGIAFSLLALWFLTSRGRRSAIYAGVCAGLALQFKITLIAAALTGCAWLFFHRRWRALVEFAVAAGALSLGLYGAISLREPEMLKQIFTLKKIIPDRAGVLVFLRQLAGEPGVLLAAAGLLPMAGSFLTRRRPRMQLIAMFVTVSFVLACFESVQFGANTNYFYEAVFAATPFAVLAFLRLGARCSLTAGILIGLLFLTAIILPTLSPASMYTLRGMRGTMTDVSSRNRDYEKLRRALDGTRILSSDPDVTILRPEPVLTEPYLLTVLSITQGVNLSGLTSRIGHGYFDAVATQPSDNFYRGVPQIERSLRTAIMADYTPYCLFRDVLFHLPKDRPSLSLASKLRGIGCEVVQCGPGSKCPGLGVAVELFH